MHLRIYHYASDDGLDITPFRASKPTSLPMVYTATGCIMTCSRHKQTRWWLDHIKKTPSHCTIVDNDNVTEESIAKPKSTEPSGNTVSQDEENLRCPLCSKTYRLIKSVQNHSSTKHRRSYTKNCPIDETGSRGPIARSSSNPYRGAHLTAPATPPIGGHPS